QDRHRSSERKYELQDLASAHAIGKPSANGAHPRCKQDEAGGPESSVTRRELKEFRQERWQINAHRDESAKCQEVVHAEQPATLVLQRLKDLRERFWPRFHRRVFSEE